MCTKTCVFVDPQFKAVRAVKLLQWVANNLNLKGLLFLYTTCMLVNVYGKNYPDVCVVFLSNPPIGILEFSYCSSTRWQTLL